MVLRNSSVVVFDTGARYGGPPAPPGEARDVVVERVFFILARQGASGEQITRCRTDHRVVPCATGETI